MTTNRSTPRKLIAGGFLAAVLAGLGASPAVAAPPRRDARPPVLAREAAAVVPASPTRNETMHAPVAAD